MLGPQDLASIHSQYLKFLKGLNLSFSPVDSHSSTGIGKPCPVCQVWPMAYLCMAHELKIVLHL